MSTIKSSAEDLTLNADGSNEIKFQINAVEKASINSSGLLTSTTIDATALTGNLPAISGASLTGLTSAQMPAGSVIQVVSSTVRTSQDTTTSGTPAEIHSAYRVTITPTATSSKILLMFFCGYVMGIETRMGMGIYRSVDGGGYSMVNTGNGDETFRNRDGTVSWQSSATIMHYDSPSTTDVCIYTPYYWRSAGSGDCKINDNSMGSFMLGMEIAG